MPWLANSRAESSGVVSSVLKRDFMWRVKAVRACRWILNREKRKEKEKTLAHSSKEKETLSIISLRFSYLPISFFSLLFPLFLSSLTLSKYFIDQRVTVLGKFCFMHLLISLGENELRGVMELGKKVSVHVGRARVISCVMDMEWKVRFFLNEFCEYI